MAQAGFCRYRGSGVEAARQVHVAALSLTGRGRALNPVYKEAVPAQERERAISFDSDSPESARVWCRGSQQELQRAGPWHGREK